MLQRAANNAYSWWVASHIRTKQSKWLEQSLQDMEEKTQYMLKMIEEDGDSFAKRAEMYYKKRPELINFVEEFYRAFRALAERYDHLSTELQNANNTIATLCPEQVQMMDEDDFGSPNPKPKWKPRVPDDANAPQAPKPPLKDWKGLISASKMQAKKNKVAEEEPQKTVPKSGLTKTEAVEEIDKLQKDILALQTVKEFVKSSYQSRYSKYCGIENQILEMQRRVGNLQDEFSIGKVIEDDEARKLMAETALKSCQETLAQLQSEHESQNQQTNKENKKIEDARQKLMSIRREFLNEKPADDESVNISEGGTAKDKETREEVVVEGKKEMSETLTVSKLADKIDELVSKVINLESAVSSQTVPIGRLRSEADDLHVQIRILEGDKARLINDVQDSSVKVKKLEEKLHGVQDLNNEIEKQNSCLRSDFSEAKSSLQDLTQKLRTVKPDEDFEVGTPRTPMTATLKLEDPKGIEVAESRETSSSQKANTSKQDDVKDTEVMESGERASISKEEELKEMTLKESGEARISGGANTSKQEEIKEAGEVSSSASKPEDPREMEEKDSGETSSSERDNTSKQEDLKEMKVKESGEASSSEKTTTSKPDVKEDKLQGSGAFSSSGRGKEEDPKDIKVPEKATAPKIDAPKDTEVQESGEANGGDGEGGKKAVALLDEIEKDKIKEENATSKAKSEEEKKKEKEFNWQHMLLNGMEDKEKILLTEYTTILRNYKDTKKKLGDMEKDRDQQFELAVQIRRLKDSIAKKDEEINRLQKRLNDFQANPGEDSNASVSLDPRPETNGSPSPDSEDEDIKLILREQPKPISQIEEKLRLEIDTILDENLDFWLRFSTSFHQVQKFKNTVQDLQQEITKLKEKRRSEDSTGDLKSEARATFSYLKEIQTELSVWVDQSMNLKDELERRFTSLCNIQERITVALKEGVEEEEISFSSHQAAKFQGEILNMKQENNKVNDELQAGVDHGSRLQGEIEKALKVLDHEFELTGANPQLRHASSRSRIPLRSFIFGTKLKKQRHSIFPFSKKYQALRAGLL